MPKNKKNKSNAQAIVVYRPRVNHVPPIRVPELRVNPMGGVISYTIMLVVIIFIVAGAVYAALKFNGEKAIPIVVATSIPSLPMMPLLTMTSEPSSTETLTPVNKVSREGKNFIMALEGFSLSPYEDAGGRCTVGYGHMLNDGPCSGFGQISQAHAFDLFDDDIIGTEIILTDDLKDMVLNQCQFDALSSFVFNVGPYVWRMSSVIVAIRLGEINEVSYELARYIYPAGGGIPLSSLLMRRKAEGRLFDECRYRGS